MVRSPVGASYCAQKASGTLSPLQGSGTLRVSSWGFALRSAPGFHTTGFQPLKSTRHPVVALLAQERGDCWLLAMLRPAQRRAVINFVAQVQPRAALHQQARHLQMAVTGCLVQRRG